MEINWPRRKIRTSPVSAQQIGKHAEDFAQKFLCDKGLKIIGRNLRYKLGEIDIIAEDGEDLVFVEVRFRSGATRGEAAESVSEKKQKRLIRAAQTWLQQHKSYQNHYCRFDLVAINSVIDIEHTDWEKNAFQTTGFS
jgi:putative endonuclease